MIPSGMDERDERKRTSVEASKCFQTTSKLGFHYYFRKSMAGTYQLAMRCPVYRRRDSHLGSRTELENLAGDGKGKGASGSNREAESTDAPERGGLPCSSDEAGVMLVERRGQVIAVGSEPTGNRRSSNSRRKAAAFVRWHEPDDARVSSPDL